MIYSLSVGVYLKLLRQKAGCSLKQCKEYFDMILESWAGMTIKELCRRDTDFITNYAHHDAARNDFHSNFKPGD